MPQPKLKEPKTIAVPVGLCRLLVSAPEDFKDPKKYDEVTGVAKALLKVLIEMDK